jgi:lipopolysaccharide export system protein LptA
MRRTRRLILIVLVLIISAVGISYTLQKGSQERNTLPKPASLPANVSARANNWSHSETRDGRPVFDIHASDFKQTADGSKLELVGVMLKLYDPGGATFDQVRSAKGDYDVLNGVLFSDGEVEIVMDVPVKESERKPGGLLTIRTSGLYFESKSGKAFTDRPARFQFDRGQGESVGAAYDPTTRELHMHNNVHLIWRGEDSSALPMEVETGSLVYRETESKILLMPWSKFKRGSLAMDAGPAVVTLNDGYIQFIEAQQARGTDSMPGRQIEYAADQLRMQFSGGGTVESITGESNARLVSESASARTTITSNRVDLAFASAGEDAVLEKALANDNTRLESVPLSRAKAEMPETRILRSNTVALYMRTGGQEIDRVETESPGTLEFLPNHPGQRHRVMNGERMRIEYGSNNQLRAFRAVTVQTRTDAAKVSGKADGPPALTWSRELAAEFEPQTEALMTLEQWDDFRYQEGDRHARASRARLDAPQDRITLSGPARVWDPSGSTAADIILLNQKTGDFEAVGQVTSTRLSEKGAKKRSAENAILSGDDPVQATADRMLSTNDHQRITYEGDALLWQGSNRIQADRIAIDRAGGALDAYGNVVTQLIDKPAPGQKAAPVFTVVHAPELRYSEKERLAHYHGGAEMKRGPLVVTGKEIRAYLSPSDKDSSLEKAIADGDVKIVQKAPDRTRVGVSEHAEYHAAEGKTVLEGGRPQFSDSTGRSTRGRRLTYFANNDKLLVEGEEGKPVESRILRR